MTDKKRDTAFVRTTFLLALGQSHTSTGFDVPALIEAVRRFEEATAINAINYD